MTTTTSTTAPAGPLIDVADPVGDQGKDGPAYADAVRLRLESKGDQVVVTVTMAGALPLKLNSSEVMGVGIDFYRPGATESEYQLFADGEPDGWYAYLQTPSGFVQYPGTFNLSGAQMVFTVPWTSIGDPRSEDVTLFADWTRSGTPTSLASEDKVPDTGHLHFTR